jgi:hypothetical protein
MIKNCFPILQRRSLGVDAASEKDEFPDIGTLFDGAPRIEFGLKHFATFAETEGAEVTMLEE